MKEIISKELFSAVTGIKLGTYYFDNMETQERLWLDDTQSTHYICWDNMSNTCEINIYELANKCKEWANQHSYLLESDITGICKFNPDETCCYEEYFEASTEPEAIFKACQWILDNKEAK